MASFDRDAAGHHGAGPAVAGQSAAGALGAQPFPLSRSPEPRAGRAVESAPRAKPRRAGPARHPDHYQRHFGGVEEYGVAPQRRPGERRDPYAVASQFGTVADAVPNNDGRWLW